MTESLNDYLRELADGGYQVHESSHGGLTLGWTSSRTIDGMLVAATSPNGSKVLILQPYGSDGVYVLPAGEMTVVRVQKGLNALVDIRMSKPGSGAGQDFGIVVPRGRAKKIFRALGKRI